MKVFALSQFCPTQRGKSPKNGLQGFTGFVQNQWLSVGLLTVYDMCKAADRGMLMTDIRLLEKAGGKSGHWQAEPPSP